MGAWGDEPWANDLAATWFASFFDGVDFDARMTSALDEFEVDEYDRVRAASYYYSAIHAFQTRFFAVFVKCDSRFRREVLA